MKRIIYSLAGALLALSFCVGAEPLIQTLPFTSSASSVQTGKFRFEKTDWGTLKAVWGPQQQEIYGKTRPTNEGYVIVYRVLNPKLPAKTPAPAKIIYALGDTFGGYEAHDPRQQKSKLGLVCVACQQKNNNVSTVVTTDGALRINSRFFFNEQTGEVRIIRELENISPDGAQVELLSVRLQQHAGLTTKKAPRFGVIKENKKKASIEPNKGHSFLGHSMDSWVPRGLAFSPECDLCPDRCELSAILDPADQKTYCINCLPDGTLAHRVSERPVLSEPECQHKITLSGWDMEDNFGGLGNPLLSFEKGQHMLYCVECPKESGGTPKVAANAVYLGEDVTRKKEEMGCNGLIIDITRIGRKSAGQSIKPGQDGARGFETTLQARR